MKKIQKKACIILTVAVVGLFAFTGCTQSNQNQNSEQPSTQSSEQGQASEQSSAQSSEQGQASEQSSAQSSEQPSDEPTSSAEPSSPKEKISLDGVKDIIAKADKPEDIFDEIQQTYQYDEDLSNEMHEKFLYWLNEDHTEEINVTRYDSKLPCSVFYKAYNSQGQTIDLEALYEYKEKITLAAVKDIISKSNPDTPWDVIFEIEGRYQYDYGPANAYYELDFWLNENHTEAITITYIGLYHDASVDYDVYDSEGSLIKSETLHHYYIPETSSTDE